MPKDENSRWAAPWQNRAAGRWLARQRKDAALTQTQVAERLNGSAGFEFRIDEDTISRWERGAVGIPVAAFWEICAMLGCDLGSFQISRSDVRDAEELLVRAESAEQEIRRLRDYIDGLGLRFEPDP